MAAETPTVIDLPQRLASVFKLLKGGRHICREDGKDFNDLNRNEEQYRALFRGLGYEMVFHGQGFYYFKGSNDVSRPRLRAMTLFALILFQDLEERKFQEAERGWEKKLLSRRFSIGELPHFATSHRRNMFFTLGINADNLIEKVLRPMARLGMLEIIGTTHFEFRSPIYRFVDLCLALSEKDRDPTPADDAVPHVASSTDSVADGNGTERADDEENDDEEEVS